MTVKELITLLSTFDSDLLVVQSGYQGRYDSLLKAEPIELVLNVYTEWYYGKHERLTSLTEEQQAKAITVKAIRIA